MTEDAGHEEHGENCEQVDGNGIGRREFVEGCGATLALALAGASTSALAQETGDIAALFEGLPKNWGRWSEDDESGALNLLGSEQAFDGMRAATRRGREEVTRFTLQLPMTGEVLTPDPDRPDVIFPPEEGGPTFPSADTVTLLSRHGRRPDGTTRRLRVARRAQVG